MVCYSFRDRCRSTRPPKPSPRTLPTRCGGRSTTCRPSRRPQGPGWPTPSVSVFSWPTSTTSPKWTLSTREYFEIRMPARTTVGVGIRGYDVEIDAVIALRADR